MFIDFMQFKLDQGVRRHCLSEVGFAISECVCGEGGGGAESTHPHF